LINQALVVITYTLAVDLNAVVAGLHHPEKIFLIIAYVSLKTAIYHNTIVRLGKVTDADPAFICNCKTGNCTKE
jgi:hypothetical protein